jgi:HlyD family secretion protein
MMPMNARLTLPRYLWITLVGMALLAGLAWAAIQGGPLASTKVTVAQAVRGDITPGISGIGTVAAQRAYALGPTVAGRVKRVLVDVGDAVKAGQLLAEMEPVDLDARSAAANAAVARAASAIAAAEAQLHDARSRQKLAASEVRRNVDLGSKGFLSASAVEGKRQQLESADAQLSAAEAALASARQDKLRLEAELSGSREQRGNLRLLATADGTVTAREAEPGSTVVAGQAVLKVADMASLRVRTRLDQGRSAGLRTGLAASVVLRSRAQESFPGRVVRIDPQSDSITEERLVDVVFENLPAGVTIGEMAEVTLQLPPVTQALLIPNAALRQHGGQTGAWLNNAGRLRFAALKTGARGLDGKVQVLDGLQDGDTVVVYSERELADNQRIEVVTSLTGSHAP